MIHLFTFVQLACLIALWVPKSGPAGIPFPLLIAMLLPLRSRMVRWFEPEHLAALDADEGLDEHMDNDGIGDFRP